MPEAATTYAYRVYAYAGSHNSAEQNTSSSAAIPAPTNPQTEKLTDKSYKLTWTDNSTGEHGFKIDRKINENNWAIAYGKVAENQISFTDTNVFRATDVEYRVYAYYESFESSKAYTYTEAELAAPTDLLITNNSITSVTLNWQDNSTGEDGFKIERKYEGSDWEALGTVTTNTYDDNDFELNTQVYYRVCAYVGDYYSSWAENDFDASIPPPENLEITASTITTVTLNWDYNYSGQDGFRIDRKVNEGTWVEEFATVNSGLTSYTDADVDLENNIYTYRIYSYYQLFNSIKEEIIATADIGMTAFGGIVFYLDGDGGGLICAESDQSTNAEWGCYETTIGGTGTGIGTGAANTAAIVAGCSESGIAARICNDLFLNGYSDWFLPSKDELNLMYQNLKLAGIGGFASAYYWSSSESSSSIAWTQYFGSGYQGGYYKGNADYVRAVRAF